VPPTPSGNMPTPVKNNLHVASADNAAKEATSGAIYGAVKWGIISAFGCGLAYAASPMFRNLTLQFRVYLWMCPTTVGSMVNADARLRSYEAMIRREKRIQADEARERVLAEEYAELEASERALAKSKSSR